MEFLNLEVRPVAFRGGMRDTEGLLSDGAMDLEGMSEDAQWCLRHENDANNMRHAALSKSSQLQI